MNDVWGKRMQRSILKKESNGISYVVFSLIVYFLYLMMPLLRCYLPQSARYVVYLITLSGAIGGALYWDFEEWQSIIINIFAVAIFSLMNYFGKWNGRISLISFLLESFLFWAGLFYLINLKNVTRGDSLLFTKVFTIFIFITITSTIVGNVMHPNASRFLATNTNADISYSRLNIGGYDFIYGIVILLPFFIYFFRVLHGLRRIAALGLVALTLIACFFTEYTTAVIICLIILMIELLRNIKNKVLFWSSLIVVIALLIILRKPFSDLLLTIRDFSLGRGLESIAERIDDIRNAVLNRTASGDAAIRSSQYAKSFQSFLNNPLIGGIGQESNLGGHSEILDILGGTGLIGFAIFASLLYQHYRNITSYIESDLFWPCIESFLVFIGIASVNTVLSSVLIGACVLLGPFIASSIQIDQPEGKQAISKCKYIR